MAFADGAKAQNEPAALLRCATLVRVAHDARIEQRRRLERIFVQKIRPNQPALRLAPCWMRIKDRLHLGGAGLENVDQVSVATLEVFQHVGQLSRGGLRIEAKNS